MIKKETLFEAIGSADDKYLEHSEGITRSRKPLLKTVAAAAVALVATMALSLTAAAVMGYDIPQMIANALSDSSYQYSAEGIQAEIDEGQWIYLEGNQIAAIIPESPTKIMLSSDGGKTWTESIIEGSDKMFLLGEQRNDVQYKSGFIGFNGEKNGYLVLTPGYTMSHGDHRIYLTSDGGKTWREINNALEQHSCRLTGAGFSSNEIGFLSFYHYEDIGPDIWWTSDGGETWGELKVDVAEAFPQYEETCSFDAQSPIFDGMNGTYPIIATNGITGDDTIINMYTNDGGLTWYFE